MIDLLLANAPAPVIRTDGGALALNFAKPIVSIQMGGDPTQVD